MKLLNSAGDKKKNQAASLPVAVWRVRVRFRQQAGWRVGVGWGGGGYQQFVRSPLEPTHKTWTGSVGDFISGEKKKKGT